MLHLEIIIGSTRPGRNVDRVMPWITRAAGMLPPAAFRLMAAAKEGEGR